MHRHVHTYIDIDIYVVCIYGMRWLCFTEWQYVKYKFCDKSMVSAMRAVIIRKKTELQRFSFLLRYLGEEMQENSQ